MSEQSTLASVYIHPEKHGRLVTRMHKLRSGEKVGDPSISERHKWGVTSEAATGKTPRSCVGRGSSRDRNAFADCLGACKKRVHERRSRVNRRNRD